MSPCRARSTGPAAAWNVTVAAARTAMAPGDAGGGVDAAGHVHAHDRRAAWLTASIASGDRAAGLALEPGAEQGIDQHGRTRKDPRAPSAQRRRTRPLQSVSGTGSPGRRSRLVRASPVSSSGGAVHDGDGPAGLAQQPRRDQPVAAVVALAAHHRHAAVRRQPLDGPRDPAPARSIRSSPATPCSSIAQRSTARIVSASGSGISQSGRASTTSDARWSACSRGRFGCRRRCASTLRRGDRTGYSTVTVFARLRGWSTFSPRWRAIA